MQTLITVGIIVLVFALITALLIPVVKKMTQNAHWEYELRRDGGVTVPGHIISRYKDCGESQVFYSLRYRYAYGGVSYEHNIGVSQHIYETHAKGMGVSVLCLPQHPKTAHLLLHGSLDGRTPR